MIELHWSQLFCFIAVGYFLRGILDVLFESIDKSRAERKTKRNVLRAEKISKREAWRRVDFQFGDVVQTKHGFDRGLVTKVDKNGMPVKVLASPGSANYTEPRYYGGAEFEAWYKTGEHMTSQEWFKRYSTKEGWQRYCEDRQNQIKF